MSKTTGVKIAYEEPSRSSQPSNDVRDIQGLIPATSTEPTGVPLTFWQQWRITAGQFWFYDTLASAWQSAGAAVTTFLGLSDTPDYYSGNAKLAVFVNPAGDALGFGTIAWDPVTGEISIGTVIGSDFIGATKVNLLGVVEMPNGDYTATIGFKALPSVTNTPGAALEISGGDASINVLGGTPQPGGKFSLKGGRGGDTAGTSSGKGGDFETSGGDTSDPGNPSIPGDGGNHFLKGGQGTPHASSKNGGVYALAPDDTADLPTTAKGGFFHIATCNGTPTGTPDIAVTNAVPMLYDRSSDKLWIYNGSWKSATFT